MHILVSDSQKHNKKIPWSLNTTWAILLMHEQMLNDPWPNVTTLFTNIECIVWTNKKGHKNASLVSMDMIFKNVFFNRQW
jgi:hypothetical protein